ncbi:hypothetical protein AB0D67_17235 [Streptosporangium sp. NPDC048047]|uniref:hypothetical protein n=1 Tax=Streptosporangium sp. NPDC048047 TaxID=3155748 RepID=UPI00343EF2EC
MVELSGKYVEHCDEAERLLSQVGKAGITAYGEQAHIATAQVHALLAVASAIDNLRAATHDALQDLR